MVCRSLPPAKFPPLFLLAAAVCLLLLMAGGANPLRAQAPNAAADLSRQGIVLFDQNKYPEAAAVYGQLLKDYPNASPEIAADAQLHLAYCNFFTGQFPPAVDGLRKLMSTPAAPPEFQESAAALLPQVLSQQAAALPPKDRKRKANFDEAIREYGNFIGKYPKGAEIENAFYGRAVAAYQIGNYDDSVRDLRQNLGAFPRSETVQESAFLLAITLGSQANLSLADPAKAADPAIAAAAAKNYDEARKILTDIIARKSDFALTNDAQFQLGQTLMVQAGASPEDARGALLNQALAAFRAVEPKEPMIAAQTARLSRLRDAKIAELRKGPGADRALIRQLDGRLLREQGKMAVLQTKDDPALSARLQCGAVFYQFRRYDETRVLMTALSPVAIRPEDEKVVLYYTTLSYANQGIADKAVAAYDSFQSKYAGDPIAENLPLVLGGMFLEGAKPDAERSNQYYADFTKFYPRSRLREVAMLQQANTSASLKRYDEAMATLDRFLKTRPKRELAAAADLAKARIVKDKGDLNGALTAFKKVRERYADLPEAEEAAFWMGWTLLQKGEAPGALSELKAFADKYPQSKLMPSILLTRAQAQQKTGAKDQALATLTEVSSRFPQSPEAAGAAFQRANIYINDKKYDETLKTLNEFVEAHPDDPQAFAAYDRIAAIQLEAKRFDAAVDTYRKFVTVHPESSGAPEAMVRLAAVWQRAARALGGYGMLTGSGRETWTRHVNNGIAASERALEDYPDAPATALGLQNLLECQQMLVEAKIRTEAQVIDYLEQLAERFNDKPAARGRILFRLAAMRGGKDPAKALADMTAAYDPAVVFSPEEMDQYSQALLAADDADAAEKVLQKLAADYRLPPGIPPAQAPVAVQEAQAIVLYGRGKIAERKGNQDAALKAFEALKKTYPRSPKATEANLGLAQALIAKGKPDEAMPLLSEVIKSPSTPLEARARSMMLTAKVQESKGQIDALDTYLKVAAFYPRSSQAPEGLWTGAQLLEKQAASLPDQPAAPNAPTKGGQLAKARKAYETLVGKYPDAKQTAEAKQRLASLPPAPTGK